VARYRGDYQQKSFSCWDQFLAMSFAQLTYRGSLRDIEACLRAMSGKLYHMGFRGRVARTTLADANEARDWRIYADFAQALIRIARPLYLRDPIGVELDQSLYALDSTTIDLCLSLFPWAKFRRHKAAVKMHTLLDLHGNIPTFIRITDGKVHDVNILDEILPESGAFYVMDQGATSLGQWLTAVMSMRGDSGAMPVKAAVQMIRATPREQRSEFAYEIWQRRRERYGPTGRADSVPF
jgi:hypothetical protein